MMERQMEPMHEVANVDENGFQYMTPSLLRSGVVRPKGECWYCGRKDMILHKDVDICTTCKKRMSDD